MVISGLTKLSEIVRIQAACLPSTLALWNSAKALHLNRQAAFFVAQNFPVGGACAAILAVDTSEE